MAFLKDISRAGGKRRNQTLCYHEKLSTRSSWTKKTKKKKTNNKTIKLSQLSFWNFKTCNTILGCIVNCDIINYYESCQYVTIYSMITNFPENTRKKSTFLHIPWISIFSLKACSFYKLIFRIHTLCSI